MCLIIYIRLPFDIFTLGKKVIQREMISDLFAVVKDIDFYPIEFKTGTRQNRYDNIETLYFSYCITLLHSECISHHTVGTTLFVIIRHILPLLCTVYKT